MTGRPAASIVALADARPRERHVAIGTFDGVHRGHQEVIRGADTVLTFDPHPVSVIRPAAAPKLLTTLERKAELVGALGVEELVVIGFDAAFGHQTAQEFVDHVLVEALGATEVRVGENFRFGHQATGSTKMLQADTRFDTTVVELLEVDGEVVSSSHIRGLIAGGAVAYAAELLSRPFSIKGEVVTGDRRGRTLGFPTANLLPQQGFVLPAHGIYATLATLPDGTAVPSATNVGVRPQFVTGRGELIEAFLLDWSGDLYGQVIRVDFVKRMRGEKRFASVDALVEQMAKDVEAARAATLSDRL